MNLDQKKIKCQYCYTDLSDEANFCSNCGQKRNNKRITFYHLFNDFTNYLFDWDSPFIKTSRELITMPGKMLRLYFNGSRQIYFSPVKYLIFSLFLVILTRGLIDFDIDVNQSSKKNLGELVSRNLNYFVLLLPLNITIFSKVFFYKLPFNLAERFVFGLYLSGEFMLISIIPTLLTIFHPSFTYLSYLFSVVFFTWAFYDFHRSERSRGIWCFTKSFIATLLSIVFYIITVGIIAYFIFNTIKG